MTRTLVPRLNRLLIPLLHDTASCMRRLLQGWHDDVICIGKTGFFPADGPYAYTTIYIKASALDNSIFQNPGLGISGLKLQIRIINITASELMNNIMQLVFRETTRV